MVYSSALQHWVSILESWKGPGNIFQLLVGLPILTDACLQQQASLYARGLFPPSSSPLHNLNLCVLGRPVLYDLNAPPFPPVLDPPLCLSWLPCSLFLSPSIVIIIWLTYPFFLQYLTLFLVKEIDLLVPETHIRFVKSWIRLFSFPSSPQWCRVIQ